MFFRRLAQLTAQDQETCFEAMVSALEEMKKDGKGVEHCLDLLRLGNTF